VEMCRLKVSSYRLFPRQGAGERVINGV
jgi:hypothetical protein